MLAIELIKLSSTQTPPSLSMAVSSMTIKIKIKTIRMKKKVERKKGTALICVVVHKIANSQRN